ncbi:hypothetical protein EIL87_19775 [Saccharopolyspora rhizosphaerae]|uniref:Uncharacterized protein n=1 Tax=Saccharopolyspora rhizosphaerae TaxID=2492662 RepID=A0A426JN97_9PSEU|nr:hypothetical protein [Saccharopolyspora rhizosphaerae]RRO14545.1 hypothetical protein EIL87_19775 [Saccharopolyspora rhizosphaerae]
MLKEDQIDPLTRELIDTALKRRLTPLCWHLDRDAVTGYVTVSRSHEAEQIRAAWAEALGFESDQNGGYIGVIDSDLVGTLTVRLPDAVDPDERCQVCNRPFDPRDPRPDGLKRYQDGDICRSCVAVRHAREAAPEDARSA